MKQKFSKNMVLATIICMDLLVGVEFDLFVPSFPELQDHFNLSPFWVEALLSANFAGYCLSLFFVGDLADHYGRKPMILFGLIIFVFGSVLCVWTPSYSLLLLGRFLQGIGVAAPAILSFLIIADSYPLKKQQFLLAMLNGVMNASVAAAPVVGSYITMYFHWQGNFIAMLWLGVLVLVMTMLFIPMHKLSEHKRTLLLRGYLPIFRSKPIMLLIVHMVFMFVPYWIFVGMSPLLYMDNLGVSLAHFGFYQGVLALVFAIGSVIYGLIMNKYDHKKALYVANYIFIASLIMLAWLAVTDSRSPLLITLALLVFVIGQIIPTTILYPLALNYMPQSKGRVSAIQQGVRLLLSAFGLQLAGYYYTDSFRNIGIIIMGFIVVAVVTLFLVIRNRKLMRLAHAE